MKKILVATRNENKVREIRAILGDGFELVPLPPEAPDVVEDGATFLDNALKKAREYSRYSHLPAIAEDSGLEVEALGGAPGVYSARYAGENAGTAENNRLLLDRLSGVPAERRGARFVCTLVYINGGEEHVFEGEVKGHIANAGAGRTGFGYDPLFIPDGYDKPFAEMTIEVKNSISHRYNALKKLAAYLATLPGRA
ncbi:MAG: RdgB/HAM1 family non-canonical purine NTP pyrophosphatase [Nitrospirae bacterium]|nr:RdgB/HAM1 family non-canonical purine NTP pyrophosphatase [Nitrospirota bacterium]